MRFSKILPWALLALAIAYIGYNTHWFQEQSVNKGDMPTLAQPKVIPPPATGLPAVSSFAHAVNVAAPSVVNIFTKQVVQSPLSPWAQDPMFRRFFGYEDMPREREASSLGSGVIVSSDGYILTNNHVVASASTIVVALRDGREVEAKLIGTDPDTDLAVIKVELTDLPALPFKTEGSQVGDIVLAIGNPFGVGQTVTQGIISAMGRSGLGINTYEDFIQTDAAINPGNSGGALVDVAGNLLGINTAIYSRSGGNMGIGFAIPAELAKSVMTEIIQGGKVVRGWLGVEVRDLDDQIAEHLGSSVKKGPVIAAVMRGGPAAEGGLRSGDVIIELDGKKPESSTAMINQVAKFKPGVSVPFTVDRQGKLYDLTVKIGERPAQLMQQTQQRNSPFE